LIEINEITFELTNKCKLDCVHCSNNSNINGKEFLDINTIKNIVQKYKPQYVNLSGGEPLLTDNFISIIQWLKGEKIKVRLYTSTYVDDINTKLKALKIIDLDYIIISYYSHQNDIYDQIVGEKDAHDIILNNIKLCLDIGLNTEVHIVPMSLNLHTLIDTVIELVNIGVNKISLLKIILHGRGTDKEFLLPNKEELNKIINELQLKYQDKIRLGLPFSEGKCTAGTEKLVVLSNGNVIPCDSYKSGKCLCERWINER